MPPESWLRLLKHHPVIAVIRTSRRELGYQMACTVAEAGIRLIEVTWNSAQADELIFTLRQDLPHCTIGTGTILNQSMLREAIAVGAQFVFAPHVDPDLIRQAVSQGVPFIPGALTPTEIVTAWQAGAYSVKLFPVNAVGGTRYIRSLQGPLPHIPLIPTGGITIQNAHEFLEAGAIAIGMSSDLFPKSLVDTENWSTLTQGVTQLLTHLNAARSPFG